MADMRIAFYAPLKSPDHPVPSGDRLMARQLLRALEEGGNEVTLASQLRTFHATPETMIPGLENAAQEERERLSRLWEQNGPPDMWFCYHPYYKAPDLIGPDLCRRFGLPYATAEASYSHRRNLGCWARHQEMLREMVGLAGVNLCFTERDRVGLAEAVPDARLARIAPFIDPSPFIARPSIPRAGRLVTVAMMRPGDKMSSYTALAEAMSLVADRDWRLSIVGGGPERVSVEALFSRFAPGRIEWLGELSSAEVAEVLSAGSVFVWPGHGEAYGLAYLEAQAAGLPVVAEHVAGVPEVVEHGRTGLLVSPRDPRAFADAVASLLADESRRLLLSNAARRFVSEERSLPVMARRLSEVLVPALEYPL